MLKPGDSERVEILRFPLILFVLYLHNTAMQVAYAGETVRLPASTARIVATALMSGAIARAAVPLFFLFAGFLFFTGFDGSVATWRRKIRRRVGTLLLPYLFWNLLITSLFLAGQAFPGTSGWFNSEGQFAHAGPLGVLDAIFGITRQPVVYPMWFIRNLMVLILLAVPLYAVLSKTQWLLPAALLLLWLAHPSFLPLAMIESPTFSVLGAWLALRGASPFAWENRLWLFAPLCLALLAVTLPLAGNWVPLRYWLQLPLTASAILTALCLPRLVLRSRRATTVLIALAPASFFVFAAHEPLMTLVRKLLYRIVPPTPVAVLTIYLLLPLAIAAFTTALYFLLRRIAPRFAALVSGNRVTARHAFRNINP